MNCVLLTSLLLVFCCTWAVKGNSIKSPRIIDIGQGYVVGDERVSQSVAKSLCDFAGKTLVSIETEAEDRLIVSLLRNSSVEYDAEFWTSGKSSDDAGSGVWFWGNGEPLFHSRWWTGNPTDAGYLALTSKIHAHTWFSISISDTAYLCLPLCENK